MTKKLKTEEPDHPCEQDAEGTKRDCPKCEEFNTLKKYKAGWACSYCFYHED